MTSESKHYIDFSDIEGVEVTCPNCGTTVTHAIKQVFRSAYNCPNCQGAIIAQRQTDDHTLSNFVACLREVQSLKAPARIRLLVKNAEIHR